MDGGLVSPLLQIHRPKPIRSQGIESKAVESEVVELIGSHGIESKAVESEVVELIGSKAYESEADESEADDSETDDSDFEKLIGSQGIESKAVESEVVELIGSKAYGSEADESKADDSETDDSETDDSDSEKLIGRECQFCLKVGDHFSQTCSYRYHVPKNAIVGKRCVVVCNLCGCLFRDSCCGVCGQSDGCAILMNCLHCWKIGEHLMSMCPSREGKPSCFSLDPYTGSVISI